MSDSGRVLIVDDDVGVRRSVRRVLLLDGYQVDMLGSARELRAHRGLDQYFAILLDRKLPDADGSELVEDLKHNAPHASILIVTGYADLDSTIKAIRTGIHDYLIKPIQPETLRNRLKNLAEIHRVRHQLSDAQQRLVQSERLAAIGQMVTGLAHESRNALQRARGCLDLLELDLQGQAEQLDLTRRIRRSLRDLQHNYEEVRNYATPIALELSEVSLAELLRQVFEDLRCEFPDKQSSLQIEESTRSRSTRADAHRLRQLFRNILDNALGASQGAEPIEARISDAEREGRPHHRIEIRDHGVGMEPRVLERLFEPFFTTKQSGTGLGMAICHRIVDAHGGHIEAENADGGGVVLRVDLPVKRS